MIRIATIALAALAAAPAPAAPMIGQPAPDFTATDSNGKAVKLSALRGRPVVLEWTNSGCPFVQKHYGSGNMQRTQAAARKAGAVWLTVNSGAPGKQGHVDGAAANAEIRAAKAVPTAYLLDGKGMVGKAYDAKTTPHLYLIDAKGTLVYAGGIDDKPTANPADIKTARNYVLAALGDLKAGKPVAVATSKPYGCSVKYGA
ncbi:redoxin domain-containing protein [Sphingomonas sp. 1P06PA]|uniref:redoxin domain-containing protein n=1 Tax=Sphingomonas sp. 1P06PA TaxID=554121 RepID=UPI0039A58ED9